MKYRDYYLEHANPIWALTHDTAIAAFHFNAIWLDEIKSACRTLMEQDRDKRDVYQTLSSIILELQEVAHKNANYVPL